LSPLALAEDSLSAHFDGAQRALGAAAALAQLSAASRSAHLRPPAGRADSIGSEPYSAGAGSGGALGGGSAGGALGGGGSGGGAGGGALFMDVSPTLQALH
jgi:hypothetical protein